MKFITLLFNILKCYKSTETLPQIEIDNISNSIDNMVPYIQGKRNITPYIQTSTV